MEGRGPTVGSPHLSPQKTTFEKKKKWEKINGKPRDLGSSDGGRGATGLASGDRGGLWPCVPAVGCSLRGP